MKAIKRSTIEQMKEYALTEIESIRCSYNHKRIKEYHKILRWLILETPNCEFIEDCEVIGKFVVYTKSVNLGTKRYPDNYIHVGETYTTIARKTPKQCQTCYGTKINDSRILCAIVED